MLALDNNLLSDYLNGETSAKRFLTEYEDEPWAVASVTLYEAYIGVVHGYIDATLEDVRRATATFEELPVTAMTAYEAARLQEALMREGIQLGAVDALIAASANEAGATLATNDRTLWRATTGVDIAEYRR
jgi:predicted nucleic acid-binding protein